MRRIKKGPWTTVQECVLSNLGLGSTQEINAWFQKSYDDKYRIDGIDEVVDMILSHDWDRIHIVGDYDADGCTATAIARIVLSDFGLPESDRIPYRFSEGYGMNVGIVDEIPDGNVLLITVDNGISALDAVQRAKDRGFTVVVVDHHLPFVNEAGEKELPNADIIIDPHAIEDSADYNGYCGAGLMYKIMCRLIDRKLEGLTVQKDINHLKWLKVIIQPIAMIGTICDQMDIVEENYVIVRNGLRRLDDRKTTSGLLSLMDRLNIDHPTETDIGFKIGPCINANGRLHDKGASLSVDMLASTNYRTASELAERTWENNEARKAQVEEAMRKADAIIAEGKMEKDFPIVIKLPSTCEGVIGIIAGKVQDKYRVPAIVFTDSSTPGELKGSGRSVEGFHMKKALDETQGFWTRYGGHEGAAGLSVMEKDLDEARKALQEYAAQFAGKEEDEEVLYYDLEISASQVPETLKELKRFAPFGNGNTPLVFKVRDFHLMPAFNSGKLITPIGTNGVKLSSREGTNAIGFGMVDRMPQAETKNVTLYGSLSYNYYRGNATPQIEFEDFEFVREQEKEVISPLMRRIREQAQAI